MIVINPAAGWNRAEAQGRGVSDFSLCLCDLSEVGSSSRLGCGLAGLG
jgi:hypothetical protein